MTRGVTVITPAWNGLEPLKVNLPHIVALKGVTSWILVDDASTDGTADWVRKKYPKVRVLVKKDNEGFLKSVNSGAALADTEFIAIINQDLRPNKEAVARALENFADPTVAGVTFRETSELGWGIVRFNKGWLELSAGQVTDSPHQSFWGSGGETIYHKKIWDELGGYDPIFSPGYWEDVDFGFRLRRRGFKIIWDPRAIMKSQKRETSFRRRFKSDQLVRIQERNRLIFTWKNLLDQGELPRHLVALARRALLHPGYFKAVIAASRFIPDISRLRAQEFSERVLSDDEVFRQFQTT